MTRDELLDRLTRQGLFSSDTAEWEALKMAKPRSEIDRLRVRRALDELEAQGLIRYVDPGEWPDFMEVGK